MPRRNDEDPFLDVPDDPPLEDPQGAPDAAPGRTTVPVPDATDPRGVPVPPDEGEASPTGDDPSASVADPDDPFEAVPDDDPSDLTLPEHPAPSAADPVSDDLDEDPFSDEVPADEVREHRPALPWRTEAMIVALGRTVPAILDPTTEASTWVGGPPDADAQVHVLWLGPLTLRATLAVTPGEEEHLRLGRDVLAGKVRIDV